jgi:hypothetical protein
MKSYDRKWRWNNRLKMKLLPFIWKFVKETHPDRYVFSKNRQRAEQHCILQQQQQLSIFRKTVSSIGAAIYRRYIKTWLLLGETRKVMKNNYKNSNNEEYLNFHRVCHGHGKTKTKWQVWIEGEIRIGAEVFSIRYGPVKVAIYT